MSDFREKNTVYDVAVIGGGPAGACAAFFLVQQGLEVVILEKSGLPRYKPCGGGITQRARRLLPFDIQPAIEAECRTAELHFSGGDLQFATTRAEPVISMTMRDVFDGLLISHAQREGAHLQSGCKVHGLSCHADRVTLTTDRGAVQARFVIGADGALSTAARRAGWKETRRLIPALEYEITLPEKVRSRLRHAVRFDFGFTGSGYAWLFPKKHHVSAGGLSTQRKKHELQAACGRYLRYLGIEETIQVKRYGFVIPVSPRTDTFVRNRVVLVGDAAGLADPLIAEGITSAVLSAQLAAHSIIAADFSEKKVKKTYEAGLRTLLLELRLARVLGKLIYECPNIRTFLFQHQGQALCEAMTDVVTGATTYRELLGSPRNYAKLLLRGRR